MYTADYYVRPTNGNDGDTGVDYAHAWKSTQKALDTAVAGKVVGLCAEADEVLAAAIDDDTNSGSQAAGLIKLIGLNAAGDKDGTRYVIDGNSAAANCLLVNGRTAKKWENVTFKRATAANLYFNTTVSNVYIFENCITTLAGTFGADNNVAATTIDWTNCQIIFNGSGGLGCTQANTQWKVRGSVVALNGTIGVATNTGICRLYNNIFYKNTSHAISGTSALHEITGNIFDGNATAINMTTAAGMIITYNRFTYNTVCLAATTGYFYENYNHYFGNGTKWAAADAYSGAFSVDMARAGYKYTRFGNATTRIDITNPAGTTFRYTWDGTGTDPNFLSEGLLVGSSVVISSTTFNAGNNGTFTVTAATDDYFEVTNAAGVAENDKVLSSFNSIAINVNNYNLRDGANGLTAEGRFVASNLDGTNFDYWCAGLGPNPDMPTKENTFSGDTTDGVTGTGVSPAAAKVMANAGGFGPGAATTPLLPLGDVLISSGQGGTSANLTAADTVYLSLEAGRNNDNGTVAGDIALTKSVKIKNTTITGASDKLYSAVEELARNSGASAGIIKSGETVKQINVDILGTYSGGALPAPSVPALGTPVALSSTSLRAYFTWAADAEKIYLSIAPALTGVYGTEIQMAAGVYQYDFTGLTAGTSYFIRARSWNTTAYSAYATAVTGTTRTTTGIEQALWNTFKTKMQADVYLAAYIVKWKFNREANILAESKFPVLKAWIVDTSEDWKGVPKSKIVRCRVIIHGIVKVKDSTNLETEKLKFDEYVKNALEADMTFDGGVTMNIVGDTIFSNLDDSTAEIAMQCEILSNRFTAGER